MKHSEIKEFKTTIAKRGMVFGLETMEVLLDKLGNPHDELKVIHVAGTNGKGSVIAFLAEILISAGYKTGVYTSPAVFHEREIFQINHKMISEDRYEDLFCRMKKITEELERERSIVPTLFEIETAMAFQYFKEESCEIVLIEAGLGGKQDATNCIKEPLCSVITSVGLDHVHILGDSIEEIALEKAGIIKEGCPVVCGAQRQNAVKVIDKVCEEKHAPLNVVSESQLNRNGFPKVRVGLLGKIQLVNAAVAMECIQVLRGYGYDIGDRHIISGIQTTRWNGRVSILSQQPLVILDGAHNADATYCLKETLQEEFPWMEWVLIVGVFADKDYYAIVDNLAQCSHHILTITPSHPRALDGKALAEIITEKGIHAQYEDSVKEALKKAKNWCSEKNNRGIVAVGSFSFLGEIKLLVEKSLKQEQIKEENHGNMVRIDKLINDSCFLQKMQLLEQLEQNRQFCRHGWEHCLDVARAAVILNAERGFNISKELIYAMALVHDIGRGEEYLEGRPHEEAGVEIAKEILNRCDFTQWEIELITYAIGHHSQKGIQDEKNTEKLKDKNSGQSKLDWIHKENLTNLLVEADKKTRLCFQCKAADKCKWPVEKRNLTIHI